MDEKLIKFFKEFSDMIRKYPDEETFIVKVTGRCNKESEFKKQIILFAREYIRSKIKRTGEDYVTLRRSKSRTEE